MVYSGCSLCKNHTIFSVEQLGCVGYRIWLFAVVQPWCTNSEELVNTAVKLRYIRFGSLLSKQTRSRQRMIDDMHAETIRSLSRGGPRSEWRDWCALPVSLEQAWEAMPTIRLVCPWTGLVDLVQSTRRNALWQTVKGIRLKFGA